MHSNVFQISTEKIQREDFIYEETLDGYDFFDYCSEISDEDRLEEIKRLSGHILPEGMFTLVGDDILIYNGGAEKIRQEWADRIRAKAALVTEENIMKFVGPAYQLKKEIENPLGTSTRFYIDGCVEQSDELVKMLCGLEPGTRLYIGGVIDWHF